VNTLRADGRRSRRRILDAAAATIVESGDLGYSALARRAGVTRATVYRHFPSADDLLGEVSRELAASFLEPLLARMDEVSLPEAWRMLAELVVTRGREHAALASEVSDMERFARAAVADEPIEAFLRRRRERGEVQSDLPDAWAARVVRALCLGALAEPDRPADESVDLLTRALVRLQS
jgi:AcrR family transcriptional regulator